jgi:outer membrane immunogenic protein
MQKALLMSAAAVVALVAVPAFAADMPVRTPRPAYKAPFASPVYNWSGPYLGMTVGYGWGDSSHTEAGVGTSGDFDVNGWLVGGTFGYNWQSGNAVFGLETDISWSNIDGGNAGGAIGAPVRTELDWFGTLRGRAGFTADASLFYVTGGLAYADVNARTAGLGFGSDWRWGWTVGAGVETMLSQNWTAKLEYLYADLGDSNIYTNVGNVRVDNTNHIVRVGLNYKY